MEWRMLRWILLGLAYVLFMAAAFIVLTTPAPAQPTCVPASIADDVMRDAFGEQMIAVGLSDGKEVHWYANPNTRTWTVIAIDGSGMACSVLSGSDLDFAKPPPGGRVF